LIIELDSQEAGNSFETTWWQHETYDQDEI
jgi:hypothetical protein